MTVISLFRYSNICTREMILSWLCVKENTVSELFRSRSVPITVMDRERYLWDDPKCRAAKANSRPQRGKIILPLLDILQVSTFVIQLGGFCRETICVRFDIRGLVRILVKIVKVY